MRKNLESFFLLDYPNFELLFSVAHSSDPAARVVRRLIRRYPKVQARLFVGESAIGINPKINNLYASYRAAKHDWLLISDSNIRVAPDYVKRQVAHLDADTGVLTCVIRGRTQSIQGIAPGAELESVFLNTFYARGMVLTARLGKPCVVGKSMLFRRSAAEQFGGMRTLGLYLAEDFMAGEAMRKLGLKVKIAHDPIDQHLGRLSSKEFWSRHIRWGRIRKSQSPLAFFLEPLTNSCVAAWLGALGCLLAGTGLQGILFFTLAHFALWGACDWITIRAVNRANAEPGRPTLPARQRATLAGLCTVFWCARELSGFPLWIHSALGSSVQWRGRTLRLLPGGLLEREA